MAGNVLVILGNPKTMGKVFSFRNGDARVPITAVAAASPATESDMTEPLTFREWLAQQSYVWRDAFCRGRISTRDHFADEAENMDEKARHVRAARMIGSGEQ